MLKLCRLSIVLIAVALLLLPAIDVHSAGAIPSEFSNANSAINSAFSATYSAAENGGNVSALVAQLNGALGLYQKAERENATNSSQASLDLQNVIAIADQVSASAASTKAFGSSAKQMQYIESFGASAAIIVIAILIYIYGGRIYHEIWFYLFRDYKVRAPG